MCVGLLFISISIFSLNVNIIGQRLSCFSLLAAYLYDWVGVSISSLVIEFFLFNSKLYLLIGFYVCPSLVEISDDTFGLLLWGNLKDQRYRALITVAMNDFENEQYFLLHK